MSDWNTGIIEEFRANDGKVGGMFEGAPLLLLHHTGAKSGTARVSPLMFQRLDDGAVAVFASKAGAHTHPDWYYNVKANPTVKVEIGRDIIEVQAREAIGNERHTIWETQKADHQNFADYEAGTTRQIPVFVLEPSP